MASAVMGTLKKVNRVYVEYYATVVVILCAVINAIVHSIAESNGTIWLGVLSVVGSFLWLQIVPNKERHEWWSYTTPVVLTLFFVIVPFMHLSSGKVWMVGDKTTISHNILWRLPFSKFATSINEEQNITFTASGKTKDGTVVVATLSGKFSVNNDEKVVIKRFGKMRNPNTETAKMLRKALQESFEQAIGTMTVMDIVMAKNNFAIERAIVTLTAVDDLGLIGNGPIVVEYLHPYFTGK